MPPSRAATQVERRPRARENQDLSSSPGPPAGPAPSSPTQERLSGPPRGGCWDSEPGRTRKLEPSAYFFGLISHNSSLALFAWVFEELGLPVFVVTGALICGTHGGPPSRRFLITSGPPPAPGSGGQGSPSSRAPSFQQGFGEEPLEAKSPALRQPPLRGAGPPREKILDITGSSSGRKRPQESETGSVQRRPALVIGRVRVGWFQPYFSHPSGLEEDLQNYSRRTGSATRRGPSAVGRGQTVHLPAAGRGLSLAAPPPVRPAGRHAEGARAARSTGGSADVLKPTRRRDRAAGSLPSPLRGEAGQAGNLLRAELDACACCGAEGNPWATGFRVRPTQEATGTTPRRAIWM